MVLKIEYDIVKLYKVTHDVIFYNVMKITSLKTRFQNDVTKVLNH